MIVAFITTKYLIFLAGVIGYIISTLSGGGGSLLLVPVMDFFIGTKATPLLLIWVI
jgi:uncharacterized membrane protein YfcA